MTPRTAPSRADVLTVDVGTSSVKAAIYDEQLQPQQSTRIRYLWQEYPDGRVEVDPVNLERIVRRALDWVLAGRRRPVAAVVIGTFWHSLLGVDRHDRLLTPLIPWSDVRADDEAARLRTRLDERRVHARTGCRVHSSYWPARLCWFHRHQPRTFDSVARWLTFGEWLERRWLGRSGVSLSQASGTGLLHRTSGIWDGELVQACGIDARTLSPLIDLQDDRASLAPRLVRRWPSLATARWLPSLGDGALNNVGAGAVDRDRAALMIGTSGAMRVLWEPRPAEKIRTPFGLWSYRLDRRRIVVGGALSNGGNVREWVHRTFRGSAGLDARAFEMPPDAHGLTSVPFLAGTRSPDYLAHARGVLAGLSLATRPEHVLRGMMEAVAYGFALVLAELQQVAPVGEIVAAGGALERSSGWARILADVLGRPITLCRDAELTSRGAAALAFEQLGLLKIADLHPVRSAELRPDRRRHRVYAAALKRHVALRRMVEASGEF